MAPDPRASRGGGAVSCERGHPVDNTAGTYAGPMDSLCVGGGYQLFELLLKAHFLSVRGVEFRGEGWLRMGLGVSGLGVRGSGVG